MESTKKPVGFRLDPERLAAMNRIAARRQLESGKRVSLQSVFEEAIDLLIQREAGDETPGNERR